MKIKFHFIALLVFGSVLSSCEKDDLEYQNEFENSRKAMLDFKESSNNSYKYVVPGGSVLVSFGWESTITVTHGKVTQRHFRYTSTEGLSDNVPQEELEWVENENEINSHEHTSAAYAWTLDEIYDKAQQEWLVNRKNVKIYFEAENNGLISSCGYVEDGCMDDCFNGINIKSIEAL
ncbi:hypothetical protein KCTC52924_00943 [Arenibacter antarcticus]|uniref:Uncharacterized protein n=1 Tax=Arenibacter antarcticus TaxID=2040469 RepID=A0ABW5VAH5_9FLAO|nr:hypothetical protein [Arenibacter sp. H213]MCM4167556.1 hypothetical protein [Arenibacter sp. H213]